MARKGAILVKWGFEKYRSGFRRITRASQRHFEEADWHGVQRDVRVTKTSCMGRCGEGPTVVVYPDGVWYRGVRADDAGEIVREHILGDRLVARIVDNVM